MYAEVRIIDRWNGSLGLSVSLAETKGRPEVILHKTQSLIVDDLKLDTEAEKQQGAEPDDDGDLCTPKSEPPTDDDKPLD